MSRLKPRPTKRLRLRRDEFCRDSVVFDRLDSSSLRAQAHGQESTDLATKAFKAVPTVSGRVPPGHKRIEAFYRSR